ncbi:glucokinase [delta proteobacterium NaphS2]|nr:glucokinase [delta proteobacterium NaphS2]
MTASDKRSEFTVLAGDIGGTHTRLGLFSSVNEKLHQKTIETFISKKAKGLEEIIARFLEQHDADITAACFGIAGPVEKDRMKTTNLPWKVVGGDIKKRFGFPCVRLINDVAATIRAIPLLTDQELFTLNRGKSAKDGVIGLVAPGTGLGQALMVWVDGRPVAMATEGGHSDFAPRNERELGLWRYLHERYGHVSVERVVSGPGLYHIYCWLKETVSYKEPSWLTLQLKESDPPKVIALAALDDKDPLCSDALKHFVSLLGGVCGNVALTGLTQGGLYLGGGIPPRILPALEEDGFMSAFTDKGRFRDLVSRIPVHVVLNDKAALLGAADCAASDASLSPK